MNPPHGIAEVEYKNKRKELLLKSKENNDLKKLFGCFIFH